jgi:hypothetical protein
MVMSKTGKTSMIDIPIRLIFSKAGVSYFLSNNRRLNKFRLSDNREELGIHLVDFIPPTVQKMLIHGYIREIEFPILDLQKYRTRIIDFAKLVTYGMLYMQFDTEVFSTFLQSEVVQAWNRKNAKYPIDFKTEINREMLAKFLKENSPYFSRLKKNIIEPVMSSLKREKGHNQDEIEKYYMITEKYLQHVNPLVWFLLISYQHTSEVDEILDGFRSHVKRYLKKSSVAEYFTLMLIEVLASLGQMNFGDEEAKAPVRIDDKIYLLWKFKKNKHRADDRGKLHVIVSNNKTKFEEVRSSIHYRAGQSVKEKSLETFCRAEATYTGETNLGLYYLSFLEEACKSLNLKFESFVNYDKNNQQTLVNLILTF